MHTHLLENFIVRGLNMSKDKIVVVKPGQEGAWDPIEECPFPLDQLSPPYPLSPEDRAELLKGESKA
jgi:hypothetical protein